MITHQMRFNLLRFIFDFIYFFFLNVFSYFSHDVPDEFDRLDFSN